MSSRLDVCAIAWGRVLHRSDARTVGSLGTDASGQSGCNFLCARTDEVVMSSSMSPAVVLDYNFSLNYVRRFEPLATLGHGEADAAHKCR
eukprot:11367133-Alexandrium_andersonii.AAC.1